MTDELLRTLAYIASHESQDTVNYVTLQRDVMNTGAKNSVLQELGMGKLVFGQWNCIFMYSLH